MYLYNPSNHLITLQVLYDDVLEKRIGGLTKNVIGAKGAEAKMPLLFGDINGRQLQIPFVKMPFRRVMYYVAKTVYNFAMKNARSHQCAIISCPSEETWTLFLETVKEISQNFETSSIATS